MLKNITLAIVALTMVFGLAGSSGAQAPQTVAFTRDNVWIQAVHSNTALWVPLADTDGLQTMIVANSALPGFEMTVTWVLVRDNPNDPPMHVIYSATATLGADAGCGFDTYLYQTGAVYPNALVREPIVSINGACDHAPRVVLAG